MIHLDYWEEEMFSVEVSSQIRSLLRRTYRDYNMRFVSRWHEKMNIWIVHFQYFDQHYKLLSSPHIRYLNSRSKDSSTTMTATLRHELGLWRERLKLSNPLRDKITTISSQSTIYQLKKPLRPYQEVGVMWMDLIQYGVVGDPVGTGKTPTVLGYCHKQLIDGLANKFLIVAPKTLTYQWIEDGLEKFMPDIHLDYVLVGGNKREREAAWKKDRIFTIVHYDAVREDFDFIRDFEWDVLIADEAQKIRNQDTLTAKCMRQIKAKQRFAATATLVENNTDEFYGVYRFVHPGLLGNFNKFKKDFSIRGVKDRYKAARKNRVKNELINKVKPYFIRRPKSLIASQLPDLVEQTLWLPMTVEQDRFYTRVFNEHSNILQLLESQGKKLQYEETNEGVIKSIYPISKILYLREVCNSPATLDPRWDGRVSKIESLIDILDSFDGKALIFSFFAKMTRLIEEELNSYKKQLGLEIGEIYRVDGQTKDKDREGIKHSFNNSGKRDILISTDTLKYGYNLQAATGVINVDCGYNPAVREQRIGRAHRMGVEDVVRIGDTDKVFVWNLLIKNSVEERIDMILQQKQDLFDIVVGGMESDLGILKNLSDEEIQYILSPTKGEKNATHQGKEFTNRRGFDRESKIPLRKAG